MSVRKNPKKRDSFFFWIVIALVTFGIIMFISAALGILPGSQSKFISVLFSQILLGLGVGGLIFFLIQKVPYTFWRDHAFYIFIFGIILTALVFIPGIGFEYGGAKRWISIGPISFQPAEFLKIAFVIYFAAWIAWIKQKKDKLIKIIAPFIILITIVGSTLLLQPDTKSLILILISALAMLFVSGIKTKYILATIFLAIIGFSILVMARPYLKDRVMTFVDPTRDPLGASYQLNQSLIAIGSGGLFGRGLGQSVQKFTYLPEPQGDSIFAVIGEELGYIGSVITIFLFLLFLLRGLNISTRAPDDFSKYLVTGLIVMLTSQAFLNITAMTGLFPLTGVPLVFISHGGTALLFALATSGIILNVSKYTISVK